VTSRQRVFSGNPIIADKVDEILSNCGFKNCIRVDRTKLESSHEAWVYVDIDGEKTDFLDGFGRCKAVLTWQNSD